MAQLFKYVGPESIRIQAQSSPAGTRILSAKAARDWFDAHGAGESGWATYVVNADGELVVAPRRSEHVACAGGAPVLAAGELRLGPDGTVLEITNNSTGFCPSESCWPEVEAALSRAGLRHPTELTFLAVFRLCPKCACRNLVKDDWYCCEVCGADLPRAWNFSAFGGT